MQIQSILPSNFSRGFDRLGFTEFCFLQNFHLILNCKIIRKVNDKSFSLFGLYFRPYNLFIASWLMNCSPFDACIVFRILFSKKILLIFIVAMFVRAYVCWDGNVQGPGPIVRPLSLTTKIMIEVNNHIVF